MSQGTLYDKLSTCDSVAVAYIADLIFIIITLPPLLGGLGLGAAWPCLRSSAGLCRAAVNLYITNMPDPCAEGKLCRRNSCDNGHLLLRLALQAIACPAVPPESDSAMQCDSILRVWGHATPFLYAGSSRLCMVICLLPRKRQSQYLQRQIGKT